MRNSRILKSKGWSDTNINKLQVSLPYVCSTYIGGLFSCKKSIINITLSRQDQCTSGFILVERLIINNFQQNLCSDKQVLFEIPFSRIKTNKDCD